MKEGFYFVHIGNDNYAPTHSSFIRHNDKIHNLEAGPLESLSSPPNCQPECQCTENPDGTWKIVCN